MSYLLYVHLYSIIKFVIYLIFFVFSLTLFILRYLICIFCLIYYQLSYMHSSNPPHLFYIQPQFIHIVILFTFIQSVYIPPFSTCIQSSYLFLGSFYSRAVICPSFIRSYMSCLSYMFGYLIHIYFFFFLHYPTSSYIFALMQNSGEFHAEPIAIRLATWNWPRISK